MRRLWAMLAVRFERRKPRERVMILAAVAALTALGCYFLQIAPQLAAKDKVRRELAQKEAELAQVQTQIQSLARGASDPDRPLRERIAQFKELIAQSEAGLAQKRDRVVPPERMTALLDELLARHGKLELVSMQSLGAAPLLADAKAGAAGDARPRPGEAERPAVEAARKVYRHSIRITVRGAYLDLLAYVNALETLPMQVFWSELAIDAEAHPATLMTITLYTVSFDKTWLSV